MKRITYLIRIIGTIVCATALNGCIRHDDTHQAAPPDGSTYLNSTNIDCVDCHAVHGAIVACEVCHTIKPSHGTECGVCHDSAHDRVS